MTISAVLAAFTRETRFEDLPGAVIDHARRSIVDLLAVALAGSRSPHLAPVLRLLRAEGAGRARIWAHGDRIAPREAAFYNALCAAARDYDSVVGSAHADLVVWPTALALAGARKVSGRDLIVAHAIGSEIIARLAAAMRGPRKGWSPTAIFGPFGAAAAAARILGLDVGGVVQALGLALTQAAGTQQAHLEQVLAKSAQAAFAARAGLFAAELAGAGLTAPREAIEGSFGLAAAYQDLDFDRLVEGLGRDWLILGTVFKKYPVCACSHALIDTMIAVAERHTIRATDVAELRAVVTPMIGRLVGGPFAPRGNPRVTAQFSLRYGLACAVLRRGLTLDDLEPERVTDPAIAELAGRITVTVDDARTGDYGPSDLHVRLLDGRVVETLAHIMPGSPARPLDPAERADKYRDCLRGFDVDPAALEDWAGRLPDLDDADAAWPLHMIPA